MARGTSVRVGRTRPGPRLGEPRSSGTSTATQTLDHSTTGRRRDSPAVVGVWDISPYKGMRAVPGAKVAAGWLAVVNLSEQAGAGPTTGRKLPTPEPPSDNKVPKYLTGQETQILSAIGI